MTTYLLTITERAPTADATDINTYHITGSLVDLANLLDEFEVNFGVLLSATIIPIVK